MAVELGRSSESDTLDRPAAKPRFLDLVAEDWRTHGRSWTSAGLHALVVYRIGRWQKTAPALARVLAAPVYSLLYVFIRNVYGIELPRAAVIGRRLRIYHQGSIVIDGNVVIGDDCSIRQNTTIGRHFITEEGATVSANLPSAPVLGNGVHIGAGAAVLGQITIGDGTRIGSNAVVMRDTRPNARVYSPPARVLGILESTSHSHHVPKFSVTEFVRLINEEFQLDQEADEHTPLVSTGMIDSFDIVALLSMIESHYGVIIDPERLDVETFDTPSQMWRHVETREDSE